MTASPKAPSQLPVSTMEQTVPLLDGTLIGDCDTVTLVGGP